MPKLEMAELYAFLTEKMNSRNFVQVHEALIRIYRQPGFHGVREQSMQLGLFVLGKGYKGKLPEPYFLSKVSHGNRFTLK